MSLSPSEAMQQAGDTAHDFTRRAINSVRKISGFTNPRITDDEILSRYPEVIAAMILAAASDLRSYVLNSSVERLATAIEEAGETICKGFP